MHIYPEIERQTVYMTEGNLELALYLWQFLTPPPPKKYKKNKELS